MNIDLTPQDRHGAVEGAPRRTPLGSDRLRIRLEGAKAGVQGRRVRVASARGESAARNALEYVPELAGSRGCRSGGSGPAARPRGGSEPVGSLGLGEARGVRYLPSVRSAIPTLPSSVRGSPAPPPERSAETGVRPGPHHTITLCLFTFVAATLSTRKRFRLHNQATSSQIARRRAQQQRGMPPHGPGRPPKHSHMLRR